MRAALSDMCWYIDVKDKTRPKLDLTAAEGDLSLRGEFMRLVSGSDMDDDMKRAVLIAGLRALSGREATLFSASRAVTVASKAGRGAPAEPASPVRRKA